MVKVPYLQLWHGYYRIRKPIPAHLRDIVKRGQCLTRSLGTANLQEANRKAIPVLAEFQKILDDAQVEVEGATRRYLMLPHSNSFGQSSRIVTFKPPPELDADLTERVVTYRPRNISLTVEQLISLWVRERNPVAKTQYEFTKSLNRLLEFLGHRNLSAITPDDIIKWKEHLFESGAATKTVINILRPVNALFRFAIINHKLPSNPVDGLIISSVKDRAETAGRQPFSPEDALLILTQARKADDPVIRWAHWIAAYSGARLEEIVGAGAADIREIEGEWCLDIRLDNRDQRAGLKTKSSVRIVPLHRALASERFLDYVNSVPPDGPLFPNLRPDGFGRRSGNATKRLGKWLRSIGILDRRKVFHSWRHTFKDACRLAQISEEVHDRLTGHDDGSVSRGYGAYPVRLLAEAIEKLPKWL